MTLRFWLWLHGVCHRRITRFYPEGWWRDFPSGEMHAGGHKVIVDGAENLAAKLRFGGKVAATREP